MTYGIWKIFFAFVFSVVATIFVYLNARAVIPGAELVAMFLFVIFYWAFTRLFRL